MQAHMDHHNSLYVVHKNWFGYMKVMFCYASDYGAVDHHFKNSYACANISGLVFRKFAYLLALLFLFKKPRVFTILKDYIVQFTRFCGCSFNFMAYITLCIRKTTIKSAPLSVYCSGHRVYPYRGLSKRKTIENYVRCFFDWPPCS